jgi:hypothetical protein
MLTHRDDRFTLMDLFHIISAEVDPKYRTRRKSSTKKP